MVKHHYIFIHCAKNWNFMKFQKIDHLGQFIIIQKIKYIYERIISSIISQYWSVVSQNLALILTFLNSLSCQKWTTFNSLSWSFSHGQYGSDTTKSSWEKCTIQISQGWSCSSYLNTCSKCPSNFEIEAVANNSRRASRWELSGFFIVRSQYRWW